jgi:hypothetical protein
MMISRGADKKQPADADVLTTDLVAQVKESLTYLDWSGSKLARAARVSQSLVSKFLRRERNLSPAASDRVQTILESEIKVRTLGPPRSSLERAPSICAKAWALLDLAPPRDPDEYERWRNRKLRDAGITPTD